MAAEGIVAIAAGEGEEKARGEPWELPPTADPLAPLSLVPDGEAAAVGEVTDGPRLPSSCWVWLLT